MRARWRTLSRLSPVAFAALAATLAIAVAAILAWQVAGWEAVLDVLQHPQLDWIWLAAVGELAAYVGYTIAYRDAIRSNGGPRLPLLKVAKLVTAGFGAHLPGGGFSGDLRILKQEYADAQDAAARVLSLGALEYALLAPAATASAAYLLAEGASIPLSVTIPWVAAVPLGFILAAWVSVKIDPAKADRLPRRIAGPVRSGLMALVGLRGFVMTPLSRFGSWFGIALYWAGDIFCLWAGLHAFGADPSIPATVLAYATGYIASRRTMPLAGAAATEALLVFALTWVGVPFVLALVGVVAYRAFNFLLALPLGLLAAPRRVDIKGADGPA